MLKCSSPLYLVIHILLHTLTQAIMHTYVTLEPQAERSSISIEHCKGITTLGRTRKTTETETEREREKWKEVREECENSLQNPTFEGEENGTSEREEENGT